MNDEQEKRQGQSESDKSRKADSRVDAIAIGAVVLIVVGMVLFYISR